MASRSDTPSSPYPCNEPEAGVWLAGWLIDMIEAAPSSAHGPGGRGTDACTAITPSSRPSSAPFLPLSFTESLQKQFHRIKSGLPRSLVPPSVTSTSRSSVGRGSRRGEPMPLSAASPSERPSSSSSERARAHFRTLIASFVVALFSRLDFHLLANQITGGRQNAPSNHACTHQTPSLSL